MFSPGLVVYYTAESQGLEPTGIMLDTYVYATSAVNSSLYVGYRVSCSWPQPRCIIWISIQRQSIPTAWR